MSRAPAGPARRVARSLYRSLTLTPLAPLLRSAPVRRALRWDFHRPRKLQVEGDAFWAPRYLATWFARGYEPVTVDWLRDHVRPGMVAVDVGANVGFFSVLLSALVGESGRVHAVEPVEENLAYLRRNLRRRTNVTVHPLAVGDRRAVREMFLYSFAAFDTFVQASLYEGIPGEPCGAVEVDVVPLDDLVDRADVVKIDVEGSEIDVLAGMPRLLSAGALLVVELTPWAQEAAGRSAHELVRFVREAGYEVTVLDEVNGSSRTVDEILDALGSGTLPSDWYGNLACVPPGLSPEQADPSPESGVR